MIRGKIVAGYRGEGFFDVEVSVTAADDGLVVTIKEGERFANGRIEVAGNRHVDVAALRKSISLGLLRPFDRLLVDDGHAPQEHFSHTAATVSCPRLVAGGVSIAGPGIGAALRFAGGELFFSR